MSVFAKILTLLRGSVREIGDSIVDANGTRIYEQEIIDAKAAVAKAKEELTLVMAKEMQAAREIERLRGEVAKYENLAVEALGKQQDALAEEVAGRVAGLETQLDEQIAAHANYVANVAKLKQLIQAADARLRDHERELAMAKTTESVYRATQTISQNIGVGGSRLGSAKESLERIKQRHQDMADRLIAGEQLEDEFGTRALEKKLESAGIGDNAERARKVMDRIRARRSAAATGDAPGAA